MANKSFLKLKFKIELVQSVISQVRNFESWQVLEFLLTKIFKMNKKPATKLYYT